MQTLDSINFQASLTQGKLTLKNPPYFRYTLRQYKDCPVILTIARKKNKRSSKQNNYLWGAVYPTISTYTGSSTEELHEVFKTMFLPKRSVKIGKRTIWLPGSTTKLTVGGMAEYIDRIIAEAGTMGIRIPSPEDYEVKTYHD